MMPPGIRDVNGRESERGSGGRAGRENEMLRCVDGLAAR